MKSIAIHLCSHQRHETAVVAYGALKRLCAQFEHKGYRTKIYNACSDAEDVRLAKSYNHETLLVPNRPLGKKFDTLLKHIYQSNAGWDWLLEYGSDNILDVEYVDKAIEAMAAGHTHICLNSFYITKLTDPSRALLFHRPNATSNIGRLTHRKHIAATYRKHGYVFDHRKERGVDSDSHARVKRSGRVSTHFIQVRQPLLVDIKDAGSLHDYHSFAQKPQNYPAVPLAGNYPEIQPQNTWQLPEKLEATPSASSSATQSSQTQQQQPPTETPSATARTKTTTSKSSRAPQAAASAATAKSSTSRRKTTTAKGKSSRAARRGQSARKD